MILGERELRWQAQVISAAVDRGWLPYVQARENQRQAMPSLVLVRDRVLLVYLRTVVRAGRTPPAAQMAAVAGAEAVVWTPADWSQVLAALTATEPQTSTVDTKDSKEGKP